MTGPGLGRVQILVRLVSAAVGVAFTCAVLAFVVGVLADLGRLAGLVAPGFERDPGTQFLTRAEAREELWSRLDVDAEVVRLDALLADVRARFGSELGLTQWEYTFDDARWCARGLPEFRGEDRPTGSWTSPAEILAPDWSAAEGILVAEAGRLGFDVEPLPRQAGVRAVRLSGPDGASIFLASGLESGAFLRASTGCRPLARNR